MTTPTVEILHRDEHILAINKPFGLRTLPDGFQPQLEHVRSLLEPQFGRLWIVHRLDKETSGVLLLARNAGAHRALNEQFAGRVIQKEYRAIAAGLPARNAWTIELPLRIDGDRDHRTLVDPEHGKPAVTLAALLESYPAGYSLLSARPLTGYTHQIRAHLAACGLPIAGDPLYRAKIHPAWNVDLPVKAPRKLIPAKRLGLHAFSVQFIHPASQQTVRLSAPYPPDFLQLIEQAQQE